MEKIKYLVIGSGVTGLSFANFVDSEDYLILEKDKSPGGYCKTIYKDGFVWDYSGHFFHFRDSEIEKYLIERMSKDEEIFKLKKKTKVYYKNTYVDFPFQKNIHQLPKEEFIDCLYDLFNKPSEKIYDNFEKMLFGKFGKSITEKFLKPYNEKLYACDLSNLDVEAMGRFFPYANPEEIIKNFKHPDNNSYNNNFTYPSKGSIQYINALLRDLDSKKIRFNSKVEVININEKYVIVNGNRIYFDVLISSMPFNHILKITNKEQKVNLSSNKVLVFNLGFNKKGKENIHWCYYPEKQYSFYRIGYYDNISNTNRMSLYVEIGLDSNIKDIDVNNFKKRVLKDLKKANVIDDHDLVSSHSVIMNPAYVHITKQSNLFYKEMSEEWAKASVYSIGRYGAWKYCSIEDNIIEAKELASIFNKV